MRKLYLLIILVIAIIALSGCTQNNATTQKSKPFIGGTTGLLINFAGESPPAEVDDGGEFPFDVVVELKNLGEYTIPKDDVTVSLVGIKPEEFSKSESDLTKHPDDDIMATKKSPEGDIREGAPAYITFSDFNHKGKLVGNTDFIFRAEVCYKYQTTAAAQVCIRKNNIDPEKNGVCEISEDKTVDNSGAPVQVTTFKETGRAKDKVGFQFQIEHKVSGQVYEKDSACSTERKYEDRVWVEVKTNFDGGLKCSGISGGDDTSGFVRLYNGMITVDCTQQVDSNSDYETPVTITLTYNYRDDTQTPVLVKHIPDDNNN